MMGGNWGFRLSWSGFGLDKSVTNVTPGAGGQCQNVTHFKVVSKIHFRPFLQYNHLQVIDISSWQKHFSKSAYIMV